MTDDLMTWLEDMAISEANHNHNHNSDNTTCTTSNTPTTSSGALVGGASTLIAPIAAAPTVNITRRSGRRDRGRNSRNPHTTTPNTSAPAMPYRTARSTTGITQKSRRSYKRSIDAAAFAATANKAKETTSLISSLPTSTTTTSTGATLSLDVAELAEKGLILIGDDGKLKLVVDFVEQLQQQH